MLKNILKSGFLFVTQKRPKNPSLFLFRLHILSYLLQYVLCHSNSNIIILMNIYSNIFHFVQLGIFCKRSFTAAGFCRLKTGTRTRALSSGGHPQTPCQVLRNQTFFIIFRELSRIFIYFFNFSIFYLNPK